MILRLDPRFPLVWRTPDTIQLGIDHPLAVIPAVTGPLERVIASLRAGVPRDVAFLIGRQSGASEAEINRLLLALGPAVQGEADPKAGGRPFPAVCIDGAGPTAERISSLLGDLDIPQSPVDGIIQTSSSAGARPASAAKTSAAPAALAVVLGHYVIEPERHGRWLRRDIPHLPVVFSDSEVRFGPLVEPGAGPCLHCLELSRTDDDAAWPALATQLLGREAPTETVRLGIAVAARVVGLIADRLQRGGAGKSAESFGIDAESGRLRRYAHRPHERCGCRSLPENVTVLAANAAAGLKRPNSVTTGDVLA